MLLTTKDASELLRLVPNVAVDRLGDVDYMYDRAARNAPMVVCATQRISAAQRQVLERLKDMASVPLDVLIRTFPDPSQQAFVIKLFESGLLRGVSAPGSMPSSTGRPVAEQRVYFERYGRYMHFRDHRMFHLPADIAPHEADVCIVGVPVAGDHVSIGTRMGPAALREASLRKGFWFDIHDSGVFTEVRCAGGLPEILCRGVLLRDAGDIGGTATNVEDLFRQVASFSRDWDGPPGRRPFFIGGDHGITFPIVDALSRKHEGLCLIHFDAHNDLFLKDRVVYSHACFLQNLLISSPVERVVSMGLRNHSDLRTANLRHLTDAGIMDRTHLFGLAQTRRMLKDPSQLAETLHGIVGKNTPCYLTIDIDVISEEALGGATSTPAGPGLEWHELQEAVLVLFEKLTFIGADIVELNPSKCVSGSDPYKELLALMLIVIDGLSRNNDRTG